jgi:hypothetical protein
MPIVSKMNDLKKPTPVDISKLMPEYYELIKQVEIENIPVVLSKDEVKRVLKDKHERSRAFYVNFVPYYKKYEIEKPSFGLSSDEKELLSIIDEMEPEELAKRFDDKLERDEQINEKYAKRDEIYKWKKERKDREREKMSKTKKSAGSKYTRKRKQRKYRKNA